MNHKELIADMQKHSRAGFMSRQQLSEYLGYKDPHSVDKYLHGLTSIGRQYFIGDIADSLLERGLENGK